MDYAERMHRVSGFFEPRLLEVYWRLFLLQRAHMRGPPGGGVDAADMSRAAVGEIGVFHGRSFLPLWALREAHEPAVAVDLFEAQQASNQDASGAGSRRAFERALRAFGTFADGGTGAAANDNDEDEGPLADHQHVPPPIVLEADSTLLAPQQLLDATGASGRAACIPRHRRRRSIHPSIPPSVHLSISERPAGGLA
eukprot:scaffold1390_cov234-Prasinococcus_capsulatus_cf.AAC.1